MKGKSFISWTKVESCLLPELNQRNLYFPLITHNCNVLLNVLFLKLGILHLVRINALCLLIISAWQFIPLLLLISNKTKTAQ
jgi:hypothetical protein